MKARSESGFAAILLATALLNSNATNAQQAPPHPVAALQPTGEVRVNDYPVPQSWTIFTGDRVLTGADGVAAISVSGRGTLLTLPGSIVGFPDRPQFLADLERGGVTLRSLPDTSGFRVRLGKFVAAPVPPAESVTEIERGVDGSFRITCIKGSVGLIEMDGARSLFLDATESAIIRADGTLQQLEAPAPTPAPTEPQTRKRRPAWLPWVLAGGGAAGAAAALAGRGGATQRPPVSPSQP